MPSVNTISTLLVRDSHAKPVGVWSTNSYLKYESVLADRISILCTTLYYSVLLCITLYYSVLLFITLYYSVLLCITLYYSVLICTTLYNSVRLCTTLYDSVQLCTTLYECHRNHGVERLWPIPSHVALVRPNQVHPWTRRPINCPRCRQAQMYWASLLLVMALSDRLSAGPWLTVPLSVMWALHYRRWHPEFFVFTHVNTITTHSTMAVKSGIILYLRKFIFLFNQAV